MVGGYTGERFARDYLRVFYCYFPFQRAVIVCFGTYVQVQITVNLWQRRDRYSRWLCKNC
jgi:hypothetical protein